MSVQDSDNSPGFITQDDLYDASEQLYERWQRCMDISDLRMEFRGEVREYTNVLCFLFHSSPYIPHRESASVLLALQTHLLKMNRFPGK